MNAQVHQLAEAREYSEARYEREREEIRQTYGDSSVEAAEQAIRKMAERLAAGSEAVTVTAEEIGAPSGYAMPRDQSQFHFASFVRG